MLRRTLKELRDGILSLTYPEDCRICGRPVESYDDGVVCSACWSDETVTRLLDDSTLCFKCGAPIFNTVGRRPARAQLELRRCGTCENAPFTYARACGAYAGALEASILFIKTRPHMCTRLRAIVRETILQHRKELTADLVIPVPLHSVRERSRGFNQATVIGKSIARDFHMRLDDRSLMRVKDTERHRAGMDVIDRRKSVLGAFEVVRPRVIVGADVLLVDDVYTTGSTVASAVDELVRAGAARVSVLTVSRVIEKRQQSPAPGNLDSNN